MTFTSRFSLSRFSTARFSTARFSLSRFSTAGFSSTTVSALGTLVVGVLLWASGAFTLIPELGGHSTPVKAAILAVGFVAQIVAPRRPAAALAVAVVLVVLDLPSGVSLPLWISLTDIVFVTVTVGAPRLRRVVAVGCGLVTVVAAAVVALAVDPRTGVLVGLLGVAFLISPLGYAQSVNATVRAATAERAAAQAERTIALVDERRRVSRELHDTVAGHVSAIAILAEVARDADDPQPAVASIRANSLAALAELREMIDVLAADGDEAVTVRWSSLAPLLAAARAVGSQVVVRGEPDRWPLRAETVLTRIAGEALTNATRHAPGEKVTVELAVDDRFAEVTITNRVGPESTVGPGNLPGAGPWVSGRGVHNMKIRAESVGGSATVGPEGDRWVVRARVPREAR
ncbi:sensor histidine kinase [Gordonia aichiensis]|uniref:sensor histidine kinase n=2 Tax=Gordonia TaxID=2053 RepID=UPI003266CC2C